MAPSESNPPLRLLFDALTAIESREERERFLDFTCRDHPALRARLERLLVLRGEVDGFFEMASSTSGEANSPDGESIEGTETTIGRYRLLDRLGEGGYGVVYLAEQQSPVKRRVALKIIRLGMETADVIARFELERQALAMMDHPNIARVLDVGATRHGRPYFVMELVEGEKITDYCDARRLALPERLKLFIRVCHAVQHAHQKGVIHRDLKPSNILVRQHDGEAVPKVIDFGIAKATAPEFDAAVTYTVDGHFVGTPAYMSPEQASGGGVDVDTRSDIYSLGALLYELLAGRPPFDPAELRKSGVDEIRHRLREVDPLTPSAALAGTVSNERLEIAARRNGEPQKLIGQIKGDLDRIVMKAVAKDRQLRYSGADALAADLTCYLNNEPVSARPPGGFYQLGKLVRRHRVAFVAGSIVIVSLILGLGGTTAMYHRANQAREAAEQARANEAALRHEAEIGRHTANAAVRVKYRQFAEADSLLAGIPAAMAEPSLESASTFRALGLWHAREGRWKQAAERFAALAYSLTRADKTDNEAISLDLQPAAAALIAANDLEGYEKLRTMAVKRFGDSSNPIVAEQVVKPCLLTPAKPEILSALEPLERLMLEFDSHDAAATSFDRNQARWRAFALALIRYRQGDFDGAGEWADKCLTVLHQNRARDAAALAVRAMSHQRRGRFEQARRDLAAAREIVEERFASQSGIYSEGEPAWPDWLSARILFQEAEALFARK